MDGEALASAFRWELRPDGIGILTLDLPGRPVNTLGRRVVAELAGWIGRIAAERGVRGLLVRSGKPGQFIAGADLEELGRRAGEADRGALVAGIEAGRAVFAATRELPFPTVALVDGPCMGGGTEWILAMDERLVSTSPRTRIGLPETNLGVIPAWGGTQRLPRLIGVSPAIEMIVGGEPADPNRAVALGLAWDAIPPDRLIEDGARLVELRIASGSWRPARHRRDNPVPLSEDSFRLTLDAAEAAHGSTSRSKGDGPRVALRAIRDGCRAPLEAGLAVELEAALEVYGTASSRNLIRVFLTRRRLESTGSTVGPGLELRPIRRIGVVGAGTMGAGIAAVFAGAGLETTLVDLDDERLAAGLARIRKEGTRDLTQRGEDRQNAFDAIRTSTTLRSLADADLVVEAITERETAKRELLMRLCEIVEPTTILASNTSGISIDSLAESVDNPARFAGLHFFSPVGRMPLVEVIRGGSTDETTISTLVGSARRIGKTPIVVADRPGFVVNRILSPYLRSAIHLAESGLALDSIDAAATGFGLPIGPIALMDEIGLDVIALSEASRRGEQPSRTGIRLVERLVESGRLGRKTGAGFRSRLVPDATAIDDGEVKSMLDGSGRPSSVTIDEIQLADRLILPMVVAACRTLEDGSVTGPDIIDLAMILGIGFPPTKGGPLRWADEVGIAEIVARIEGLPDRLEVPELMTQMARVGGGFHGADG